MTLDATALAEQVRSGEVTPAELTDAAIARIEKVDPTLNAVVHRMYDEARGKAAHPAELPDGPFRGVPFVVKDFDGPLKGHPYTMGSRFMKDYVPDYDATLMKRFKASGLVLLAKTNCPEMAILGTTEPVLHGATHNPWDTAFSSGGSSGGTGVLVGARAIPMGHGGDGGGSLRIPASCNGVFALKVTRGRVPMGPDLGEGWGGYVEQGVITVSVRDTAGAYDAICGHDEGDPYYAPPRSRTFVEALKEAPRKLRIAFSTRALYADESHPDCVAAVQDAAKLCEALGHEVVEAHLPVDRGPLAEAYLTQVAAGTAAELDQCAQWTGKRLDASQFEPSTWFLNQLGRKLSAVDLQHGRDLCHHATRVIEHFFEGFDVYLSATMAQPPARLGEWDLEPAEKIGLAALRVVPVKAAMKSVLADMAARGLGRTANTMIFNQSGHPAMSVPLFWSDSGLPIGVQFAAPFGDEDTLLQLAKQLEEARPWADRRPPVVA